MENIIFLQAGDAEMLKPVLDLFERVTVKATAVHYISGGFALAEYKDIDENYIYIKLKWGVQNDAENQVFTEYYKLPRHVLNDEELSNEQKCNLIENE